MCTFSDVVAQIPRSNEIQTLVSLLISRGRGGGGEVGGGGTNSEIFGAGVCHWNFEYTPVVVVVQIFNATRHPKHIEAAAIAMCMYLYSLAFMEHPCTLGAAVCHQTPLCPIYTQPRARRV